MIARLDNLDSWLDMWGRLSKERAALVRPLILNLGISLLRFKIAGLFDFDDLQASVFVEAYTGTFKRHQDFTLKLIDTC